MMCFNPKFCWGPNLSFFGLGPWAIIHGMAKLANTYIAQIRTLMTPFERSPSKLSENQKIIEIGCTEFKLWQLKNPPKPPLDSKLLLKCSQPWTHSACVYFTNALLVMLQLLAHQPTLLRICVVVNNPRLTILMDWCT